MTSVSTVHYHSPPGPPRCIETLSRPGTGLSAGCGADPNAPHLLSLDRFSLSAPAQSGPAQHYAPPTALAHRYRQRGRSPLVVLINNASQRRSAVQSFLQADQPDIFRITCQIPITGRPQPRTRRSYSVGDRSISIATSRSRRFESTQQDLIRIMAPLTPSVPAAARSEHRRLALIKLTQASPQTAARLRQISRTRCAASASTTSPRCGSLVHVANKPAMTTQPGHPASASIPRHPARRGQRPLGDSGRGEQWRSTA